MYINTQVEEIYTYNGNNVNMSGQNYNKCSTYIYISCLAAVFSCRLCFLRAFPFISLILLTTAGL